ncbi:MAG TPA: hypothetical protein VF079_09405 [Sphingomicrobium sp.]
MIIMLRLGLVALALAAPSPPPAEPESGMVDPPPGSLDYVALFPAKRWVFGKLLWQGRERCSASSCEAAYNASPLFLLVQKQDYCCGSPGYSVMIIGRAKNCDTVSYYLLGSEHLLKMSAAERLKLVERHVDWIAEAIRDGCGIKAEGIIPKAALAKLQP